MSKKNTLLWKISSDKLPADSFVFGTMHIKDQRAFRAQELVFEAICKCNAFATEFNLDSMVQNVSASVMDLPEGQQLSELLRPKIYQKLQGVFQKHTGLDLSMLDNVQPMLIVNILSERLLSSDMQVSLDQYLWNYAKQQEKLMLGIETFEEQMAILQKIPMKYQLQSLVAVAKNFKKFRRQLLKMTAMYEDANIQKLHRAAKKSIGGLRKILLYDRNQLMAHRIAIFAREQSICAAIGAAHLGGKKGVLRLLKLEGFKVKPVFIS